MYYCLKHISDGEKSALVRQMVEEEDMTETQASKKLQKLITLSLQQLENDNMIYLLESYWIDNYQLDFSEFIADKLKGMSGDELRTLACKLIKNPTDCEVYGVNTEQQALDYLREIQSVYALCHDNVFFEQQFEPEFRQFCLAM
jgi:hypothetical protein